MERRSISAPLKRSPGGCHAERSEASPRPSSQTLREVYPERSEGAQGDSESTGQVLPVLLKGFHHGSTGSTPHESFLPPVP